MGLGMGVMINILSDQGETSRAAIAAVGRKIGAIALVNDSFRIVFEDATGIELHDDGQSCCEHRYMVCDDDLSVHVGATLTGIEIMSAPDQGGRDDVHEVQFLNIKTSRGVITCSNHNEHNGYYGGFALVCTPIGRLTEGGSDAGIHREQGDGA